MTDPAGTQYSETELMTYYATPRHTTETFVWAPRSTHYYVDFADGKPAGVTDAVHNLPTTIKVETTQDTMVPTQVPTLDDYTFEGYAWNGKTLKPGDAIEKQSAGTHITLTAVWEKTSPKTSSATTYTTPSLSIDLHSELPANQDLTVPYAGTDNHLPQTGDSSSVLSAFFTAISVSVIALVSGCKARKRTQR